MQKNNTVDWLPFVSFYCFFFLIISIAFITSGSWHISAALIAFSTMLKAAFEVFPEHLDEIRLLWMNLEKIVHWFFISLAILTLGYLAFQQNQKND